MSEKNHKTYVQHKTGQMIARMMLVHFENREIGEGDYFADYDDVKHTDIGDLIKHIKPSKTFPDDFEQNINRVFMSYNGNRCLVFPVYECPPDLPDSATWWIRINRDK